MKKALLAVTIAAAVAGCASTRTVTESKESRAAGGKLYAYVVLGEEGRAVARVITTAAACPAVELDGATTPMEVRARPETIAQRPTSSAPAASKPSAFPVLVCEKGIPAGIRSASVDGRVLPLPKPDPENIVVLGDSGCRIKLADNVFQACNDRDAWPFPAVAAAAAQTHPDLVVHVGDYHYRETECPAGNAGCAGSPWGYGWDAWEADFFAPAQPLLAAAPWIVVRGNHESCNRAGQGWWRFLDPRPAAPGQNCNVAADDAIGDYSEPYAVPIGTSGKMDSQFVVFDSSLVGLTPLAPGDPMYVKYRAQYERAFALADRHSHAFFMIHHPVLGFAPNPAKPGVPYPGNAALQSVLQTLRPTALFPPSVQAVLSGHVHLFQAVSFSTGQPPQLVAGNGGDWLDASLLPIQPGLAPAPGATVANITATNRFGFLTLQRGVGKWQLIAWDRDLRMLTVCTLVDKQATCSPVASP